MAKNRFKALVDKSKPVIDDQIWSVWYKERGRFTYITNKQLQDLIDIDRVKITGGYQDVDFDGIKQKVWVDAIIVLSAVEQKKLDEVNNKPRDYEEKQDMDNFLN